MNASHPRAVEAKKEGGPSRANGIKVPKVEDHADLHRQTGGSDMKFTTVGVDIAKSQVVAGFRVEFIGFRLKEPLKQEVPVMARHAVRNDGVMREVIRMA
jgi:hypothetical protein